ncbi:MAG: glycerol-3-phosphate dehydrogenase/oxidase [Candidatus Obscuribacterales bacterium]|nr:glycerol-3-phosphate dehydrogenase/oxidase [Candidatus Obscuribacterales bacterium]
MKSRRKSLELATSQTFDLVIIGGGITGAGIAQNAASRGLSVLVVEKNDFSSGTSSKTTKLIHGGLRYLEQLNFSLTRHLCQERERLKRLAPNLVRDFSFILPFTKANQLFNFKAALGLTFYDLLTMSAGTGNAHGYVGKNKLREAVPSLSNSLVSGGMSFHDAITDDTRMVLAVLKSAEAHGAVLVNYVQAQGFELENNRIAGVKCRDRYSGKEFAVKTKACVNATGIWTDEICSLLEEKEVKRVVPAKGIHIIVPSSAFETNTALFLPTKDKRFVFVVPWQRALMIGTTDTPYTGDINKPLAESDEIDYLLSVVNAYTDKNKLKRSDVTASFAGLRPLVRMHGEDSTSNTGSMSRDHLIFESKGGLLNVAGGKLTSYRLMAQELMDKLLACSSDLSSKAANSNTDHIMLGGWQSFDDFLAESAAISARARNLSIEPASLEHLIANYGREAHGVLDLIEQEPALNQRICTDFPPLLAEVPFCVENEMTVSLEDMLFRRTRLGILNSRQCLASAPKVAQFMQRLLHWDEYRLKLELAALETEEEQCLQAVAPNA